MPTAPFFYDTAKDKALQDVINAADRALMCTGDPADYSDADTLSTNGGHKLGERNLSTIGHSGPSDDGSPAGRKKTLKKAGFIADVDGRTSNSNGWDTLVLVDDDNSVIVESFSVDDGNGNPIDVIAGEAYNNLATETTVEDAA